MSHPQMTFTLPAPPSQEPRQRGGFNKPLWLIGIGLLVNAAVMLFSHGDIVLDRTALAQAAPANTGGLLGARGIYMMPAQLGPNAYGLYLMDVDSGTICVYKATPESSRFRLMASRSFKYDRFVEDFNNDAPHPKDVQKMTDDQRQRVELQQKDEQPTVEQTPKPDENKPDEPKELPK